MTESILSQTIYDQRRLLQEREIGAEELVQSYLERIGNINPQLNAYITLNADDALASARDIDRGRKNGMPSLPLAGIPIAIKDNICTKGLPTTCASAILKPFIPPFDAFVVQRLRQAGAVIIGKCNMDEFAMGSSTETSAFGPVINPWSADRVPGGSSGGSAAIVSADLASAALGSDTGGSIRQPAAFCGVVGLKPTYGRVSRFGLVAFASSLDQIGPITKDVRDCALLFSVISGKDAMDSTSVDAEDSGNESDLTGHGHIRGIRIGVPREYFVGGLDREVNALIQNALERLGELDARVEEASLPHTEYAIATYYLIAMAEASSNLARYDGVKYGVRDPGHKDLLGMYHITRQKGFGEEVKRRIMLGTYALSSGYYDAYYLKALKVRTLIKRDFDTAFNTFDVLVTPTTPTPPFKIGENITDPLQMYLNDIFTISVNLAGIPAISIPCGFTEEGLPVGIQILGKPFGESMVLRVAYSLEQALAVKRPRRFWEEGGADGV